MADTTQAADMGFATPTGQDLISDGDDAITTNAVRAAALIADLQAAVDPGGTLPPNDTGWRDVTSLGWISGGDLDAEVRSLYIRRRDRWVHLAGSATLNSGTTSDFPLPAGFGPDPIAYGHVSGVIVDWMNSAQPFVGWIIAPTAPHVLNFRGVAGQQVSLIGMSWITADAWPTSLPGTAA